MDKRNRELEEEIQILDEYYVNGTGISACFFRKVMYNLRLLRLYISKYGEISQGEKE